MGDINNDFIRETAITHEMADHKTLAAFERFTKALESIADGGVIDRGLGMGSCDFWVKIAGFEWLVEVKPSVPHAEDRGR